MVVEDGTHDELLGHEGGAYARLWNSFMHADTEDEPASVQAEA